MRADATWLALREALIEAQRIGAIGAAPIDDHLAHATAFVTALEGLLASERPRIVDLGSGAGLPGLVVALLLPSAEVGLLEGRTVRAEQLGERVAALGLSERVSVISRRAEEVGREGAYRGVYDVAVARGFASPAVTAECAAPLLRPDGLLCVSEPPSTDATTRWPAEGCATVGLRLIRSVADPYAMAVLRQVHPCPDRYPRRIGVPGKRPLF